MTFPPGGLLTWKPQPGPADQNFLVGAVSANLDVNNMSGVLAPLTSKGLGRSTLANGDVVTIIGPPWLPLVAPSI